MNGRYTRNRACGLTLLPNAALVLCVLETTRALALEPLVNPGCEAPLVNGRIPGWQTFVGDDWTARTAGPPPAGGLAYFAPGTVAEAELRQESIACWGSHASFSFHYRTGIESPSDVVRVICEFRNEENGPVIETFDSGELTSPDRWSWHSFFGLVNYPQLVRVRLLASRRSGATTDAWVDSIYFWIGEIDPVTPATWSRIKALYRSGLQSGRAVTP